MYDHVSMYGYITCKYVYTYIYICSFSFKPMFLSSLRLSQFLCLPFGLFCRGNLWIDGPRSLILNSPSGCTGAQCIFTYVAGSRWIHITIIIHMSQSMYWIYHVTIHMSPLRIKSPRSPRIRCRTFYFHVETRQTTWEDPSELIMGQLALEVQESETMGPWAGQLSKNTSSRDRIGKSCVYIYILHILFYILEEPIQ